MVSFLDSLSIFIREIGRHIHYMNRISEVRRRNILFANKLITNALHSKSYNPLETATLFAIRFISIILETMITVYMFYILALYT